MSITVDVSRDKEGTPTSLIVTRRGRKTYVRMETNKLIITGRMDEEIRDIIQLYYPYTKPAVVETTSYDEQVSGQMNFGGAAVVLVYTVPQNKKLIMLQQAFNTGVTIPDPAATSLVAARAWYENERDATEGILFDQRWVYYQRTTAIAVAVGPNPRPLTPGTLIYLQNLNPAAYSCYSFCGVLVDV